MKKLPAGITIETLKLKPIRCKGHSCNSPIGFAYEDTLLLSRSRPSQTVKITGDDLIFSGGARRRHAKAVRFLARRSEGEVIMLFLEKTDFEGVRLRSFAGRLHYVLGVAKKTVGKGISIICVECKSMRKIRGMGRLVSTELVDILIDKMTFKN
jgi:hypothetical protein